MKDGLIKRKEDHLRLSLGADSQSTLGNPFELFELIHESLPDLDFSDVEIETPFLDGVLQTPFFVPGMTAGHDQAIVLNDRIAAVTSQRGWLMGIGSQRREIDSGYVDESVRGLVKKYPKLKLISNLGITQLNELYQTNRLSRLSELIEQTEAILIAIHLNPLQEAIQVEGTPQFKGALDALRAWVECSPIPVVVKETGSGMSESTLLKLKPLSLYSVDVSGVGGTHWGRIEGLRAPQGHLSAQTGLTFGNWGVSTPESLQNAVRILKSQNPKNMTEIWASGGIRNGLDAAKAIALGATRVGFAKPILEAAVLGEAELNQLANRMEMELKIALFCTNSKNLNDLNTTKLKGLR